MATQSDSEDEFLDELLKAEPGYDDEQEREAPKVQDLLAGYSWKDIVELHRTENLGDNLDLMSVQCKSLQQCTDFAKWLTEDNTFKSIDFVHTCLAERYCTILCDGMCGNTYAKTFSVSGNEMSDSCCQGLSKLIAETKTLTFVDISGNQITAEGGRMLASGLAANSGSLEKLDLGGNSLGNDGVKAFAEVLASCHENFQELDLLHNNITEAGANHIADALKGEGVHLQKLRMDSNQIGDTGALHFAAAIRHNPKMCIVTLCNNNITFAGKGYIEAASEGTGRPKELMDVSNNPTDPPKPKPPVYVKQPVPKSCRGKMGYCMRRVRCGRRRPLVPLAEQIDNANEGDLSGFREVAPEDDAEAVH